MIQTIKKGDHFATPRLFRLRRSRSYRLKIRMWGEGLVYDHGNEDNLDWNKLAGGSFSWFQPHGRAYMVVWRYNALHHAIELTPYYHNIKGDTSRFKKVGRFAGYVDEKNTILLAIALDGSVELEVAHKIAGRSVETTITGPSLSENAALTDKVEYSKRGAFHSIINPYFGGNQKAKNPIHFMMKYERM